LELGYKFSLNEGIEFWFILGLAVGSFVLSFNDDEVIELGFTFGFEGRIGLDESIVLGQLFRDCVGRFVGLDRFWTEEWINGGEVDIINEGDVVKRTSNSIDDRMTVGKVDGTENGKLDGISDGRQDNFGFVFGCRQSAILDIFLEMGVFLIILIDDR